MANKITLEEALSLVNTGGWRLCGGRMAKEAAHLPISITEAKIIGYVLALCNGENIVASVNTHGVFVQMTDENRPRRIAFHAPRMISRQRKKIHGGGWHDVEQTVVVLELLNPAAQAQYAVDCDEKCRVQKEATKLREQAERDTQRQIEEQAARDGEQRLVEYVAQQRDRLRGACFEDICIHGGSVTVKFSGGIELVVALHDREDPFDWRTDASLSIVIGGEHL